MTTAAFKAFVVAAVYLCGAELLFGADPKHNNAAAAVEGMFPGGVSRYLERFNEPALGIRTSGLRITRLSPGALLCIRIVWPPTPLYKPPQKPIRPEPQVMLKRGAFNHPDSKGVVLSASPDNVNRLLATFRSEELFNLTTRDETGHRGGALDAAVWVFERWDHNRYRIVAREGPHTGPVKRCADAVLELLERVQPRE